MDRNADRQLWRYIDLISLFSTDEGKKACRVQVDAKVSSLTRMDPSGNLATKRGRTLRKRKTQNTFFR